MAERQKQEPLAASDEEQQVAYEDFGGRQASNTQDTLGQEGGSEDQLKQGNRYLPNGLIVASQVPQSINDKLFTVDNSSLVPLVCPTAPSHSPSLGTPENEMGAGGRMYISTAITYQTHIQAGQEGGRHASLGWGTGLPANSEKVWGQEREESKSPVGKLMSKSNEGQNLPYIPDNTLARLTVKELNMKMKNLSLGRDEMVTLKQRRRTLKNRGYAVQCRLRKQQYKSCLEMQVQGLQEQLRRCEDELKATRRERNFYLQYYSKCCGQGYPLNLEMVNNIHETGDCKRHKDDDMETDVESFQREIDQTDGELSETYQFATDVETTSFAKANPLPAKGMGGSIATYEMSIEANQETVGQDVKTLRKQSETAPKKHKFNVDLENVCNWKMEGGRWYMKRQKTDFTLVFDGEEVPCHKHILAAASPVLEAMVENNQREVIEDKANVGLSQEVGRALIRFIYTGKMEEELLKEHASAFLSLGEMFELPELKEVAEAEMLNQLTKENMVQMISLGELFKADNIFEAALRMRG